MTLDDDTLVLEFALYFGSAQQFAKEHYSFAVAKPLVYYNLIQVYALYFEIPNQSDEHFHMIRLY